MAILQHHSRPLHKQSSKVSVSPFADPEQPLPATGGILTRNHSDPRRQIAPSSKAACIADRGDQRGVT